MRHPAIRSLAILLLPLVSWGARCAPSYAQDAPAADSLQLDRIMLIGASASTGPLVPFIADDKAHLAYELYLTNYGHKPTRIVSLNIRGTDGAPFETKMVGETLKSTFTPAAPASRLAAHDPVLPSGASGMIYVFLNFSGRQTPRRIENSIVVEADGEPNDAQRIVLDDLSIARHEAAPVGDPLTGDRWLAVNGPSNTSLHRRAVIVLDGRPRVPERYAIDFIKLGDDGNSFSGDQYQNTSYHAYRERVLAVADGAIVATKDGIRENVPHMKKLAVAMTLATIAGNHVVEDIGGGRYVGYAHLIPGTVAVKAGDRIRRGQLIGRLGNSGNSSEPHLHLQICNGPSFLKCEGVPMEFKRMSLAKYRIDKHGDTPVRLTQQTSRDLSGEEPMEDELVTFSAENPPLK